MCCRLRGGGSLDLRAPEPRPRPSPPAPLADWPTGLRCARPIKEDDGERGAEEKTERGSERRGEAGPEGGGGWEGRGGGRAGRDHAGRGRGGPGTSWFAPVAGAARDLCVQGRSRLKVPPPPPPPGAFSSRALLARSTGFTGSESCASAQSGSGHAPPAPPGFPPREARAVGLGRAGGTCVRESRRGARGTAGGKGKGRLGRIRPIHPCRPSPRNSCPSSYVFFSQLQLILCRIPPREDCDHSYPLRHAAQPGNNHRQRRAEGERKCFYWILMNIRCPRL
ncbi:unnamed protein product [Nyctereutes procyonoides]|uniref:(raccoon dog) hypothetical protein n=1 Tax=Nyctereutes procyonoides TaxID=34880 RepID=A0A811ZPB6_NYCPR|nr:unnamed protein product [Nyctereutes procyonoides]